MPHLRKKILSIALVAAFISLVFAAHATASERHSLRASEVARRIETAIGLNLKLAVVPTDKKSAFILPDDTIVISDSAISACRSDDELAFIIAHEAAHMLANDRYNETRADVLAIRMLKNAGYDPTASTRILTRLAPDGSSRHAIRVFALSEYLVITAGY